MTRASPAVLVIASDARQRAWLTRILRAVVSATSATAHLDSQVDLADFALVVANYDGLDQSDRARLFVPTSPAADEPRLLLISSAGDYQSLLAEIAAHQISNLFVREVIPARDLIVTAQKILRQDIFGLDKYFGWGLETNSTRIHRSEDRNAVVDQTVGFANTLDIHPRLVENIATVVEELITNALYNAPVDAAGRPRFAHLPRTAPVELGDDEEVIVSVCCDGHTFGVSVADSFGAMTGEGGLAYLADSSRQEAQQSSNTGGAGLGLFMIFDSLNHMAINICPNKKTEVIGLIDVRGNYRDFVHRGKSFNVFHCPGEE